MRQARAPERALTVTLPGGLVLDDRCLAEAELRPLSGREEDWLARHRGQPSARIVTRVLEACLLRLGGTEVTTDVVRRLLVGDREFLMLQLRALTLGPTVQGVLPCPACAARMDVAFDITDVPVERRPQTAATYTIRLGSRGVRVRLPNGADQEAVLDLPADAAVAALLERCIVDDGGVPVGVEESHAVIEAMEQRAPQVELELDLTCPECAHAFVTPFDVSAFFIGEMRLNAAQLLRETHALALAYHWSEADILGLDRERRRAYLDLLHESVPRA